jgi:hypothetical protein
MLVHDGVQYVIIESISLVSHQTVHCTDEKESVPVTGTCINGFYDLKRFSIGILQLFPFQQIPSTACKTNNLREMYIIQS